VPDVTDTTWLDATAQADLVRRGEASPQELVDRRSPGSRR
jgi:amidase